MNRAAVATALFVALCFVPAWLGVPRELAAPVALGAVFLGNLAADGVIDVARALGTLALSLYISGLIAAGLLDPAAEG